MGFGEAASATTGKARTEERIPQKKNRTEERIGSDGDLGLGACCLVPTMSVSNERLCLGRVTRAGRNGSVLGATVVLASQVRMQHGWTSTKKFTALHAFLGRPD